MKRRGCSVLPFLAACIAVVVLLAGVDAAPQGEPNANRNQPAFEASQAEPAASALPGASHAPAPSHESSPNGTRPAMVAPAALLGGWISWADPELGGDYLATRFPRGTLVRLCSDRPVCILRISNDFGPSVAIDPPRIADLAVLDWEQLCGLPRSRGLCFGTIEALPPITLPATDAVQ